MTIAELLFDAAYGLFASDMPSMLFFVQFIVPQFNSNGQDVSPVKTDGALPATNHFATIKINQIGRAKQPK